jgi:tetratricopeptide (TPR) repeat protein
MRPKAAVNSFHPLRPLGGEVEPKPNMGPMRSVDIHILIAIILAILLAGCQSLAGSGASQTGVIKSRAGSDAKAYHYFLAGQQKLKQGDLNEAVWLLNKAREYDPNSNYLKLETANLLLIKKKPDEALALIEEVLDRDPENLKALVAAGRIYQQRDEPKKAAAVLERALAADPSDQNIYLLLGRIYWDSGDISNTVRVFEQMVNHLPDSYMAHFFHGKALQAAGKLELAEQALLKSLDLEPSLREPRKELLGIYKIRNQPEKIIGIYESMLEDDPTDENAILGLAEHYRALDRPEKAEQLLVRLGRLCKSKKSVVSKVFETYLETKQYDTAIWVLQGMLKAAPDNSDLHYMAGIAADGLDQHAEAVDHLLSVEPASRFYSTAVLHAALIFHDMGKIDRAITVVQNAVKQSPETANYYLYLGSFFEELERYDEAIGALQKGLQVDSQNARMHFRLGVIYDKTGRKQESIDTMKMVIQLSPEDAEALNYLGYTYADLGINLDEAETLIQTALQLKPNDGYITDSLGWVYYKRGNYPEALQLLQKAIRLVPDDPVILEHLGDVYQKLDRKEKAINFYKRSLDNNAKDRDTLEIKIRELDPRQSSSHE